MTTERGSPVSSFLFMTFFTEALGVRDFFAVVLVGAALNIFLAVIVVAFYLDLTKDSNNAN
jgi:hypothetical protein